MPKPLTKAEFNTFVAGLITEASPLNFPQNASADEENFVLNKDGTRNRRLGLRIEDYVSGPLFSIPTSSLSTLQSFKWNQPGGVPDKEILVIRSGNTLRFYDIKVEPLVDGYLGSVTPAALPVDGSYKFTAVNGVLIVASGKPDLVAVEYIDSVFSHKVFRVKTRDLWGVECKVETRYETDPKFNGGNEDNSHFYNLANQSWGVPRKNKDNVLIDPVDGYFSATGKNPSNSEQVWTGLQFQPVSATESPYERMYYNLFEELAGIGSIAPKGYFIIDAVERGASRTTEYQYNHATRYPVLSGVVPSWPADRTIGGPSVVAEFAGRVFYGGFPGEIVSPDARSPNLSNYIFFSQLVKNSRDIGACYQSGDPTSRDESDVVETDGGFIRVTACDSILEMLALGPNLVIFGSNGIWLLSGGSDYGFSATNYKLDKISSFGCYAPQSIVEERGRAFYWAETGINVVARNQYGDYEVTPLTDTTIASYYQSIPNIAKVAAKGAFDPVSKKVTWCFNPGDRFTSSSQQKEITLDLTLNAFSKMKVFNNSTNSGEVIAPFISPAFRSSLVENGVVSGVDTIIAGSDAVVVTSEEVYSDYQSTKYIVAVTTTPGTLGVFTAAYTDTSFSDWRVIDGTGVDAKAYLLTGAMTGGDSSVNKLVPYLTFHFKRTETIVDSELVPLNQSGCKFRCHWGWTNSIESGRWSAEQQVYRYTAFPITSAGQAYTNHSDVVTTKNKVRGYGKALAFSLQTEPNKDCQILGWSISLSGNSYV